MHTWGFNNSVVCSWIVLVSMFVCLSHSTCHCMYTVHAGSRINVVSNNYVST